MKHFYLILLLVIFSCSEDPTFNNPYNSKCDPDYFAPDSLKLEQVGVTSVKMEWKQKIDKIDGFKIDRKVGKGEWKVEYDITNKTEYTDTAAIPGTSIRYRVYAYADENNSAYTEKHINLNFTGPDSLQLKQLSLNNIQITWRDNCHGEDGYKIDRRTGDEAWESEYEILSENIEEWNDNNPKYGVINRYRVYAFIDQKGSNVIEGFINNIIPTPSNLNTDVINNHYIKLSWKDNCDFEEGYKIVRLNNIPSDTIINLPENTNQFIDTTISKYIDYKYSIFAYSGSYKSNYIESSSINTPLPGTKLWELNIESAFPSHPAIGHDGIIYIGLDNILYAINPDKSIEWSYKTGNQSLFSPSIGRDGTIYIGGGGYDNKFYSINNNGSINWEVSLPGMTANVAIGRDGIIYLGQDSTLYAFNSNGEVKWKFMANGEISSPIINSNGIIYFGCDNYFTKLYAIDSDGNKKWEFKHKCAGLSRPTIGKNGTVFIGSNWDTLYAINPDGDKLWAYGAGGDTNLGPSVSEDGTLYLKPSGYNFHAINPNGTKKWTLESNDYNFGCEQPLIDNEGNIYINNFNNNFYVLNPDGTTKWKFVTEHWTTTYPTINKNGVIYFYCNNVLYAIQGVKSGLATSSWPMYRHDPRHTGRID